MSKKQITPAPAAPARLSSTLMPATSPGGEGNGAAPHRQGGPAPVGQTISGVIARGSPRPGYTPGGRGRGPSSFFGNIPQPGIPADVDCKP